MHDISIMNGWTPKRGHTQRGRERLRERIIFFRSAFRCEEVRGAAAHCEGKEWDWRMWASGTASPSDLLVALMLAVSVACGRWHFNMPNCALAFASINEILLRKTEFQNDVRGVGALSLANITMSTACFPIMANSMAKFAFYIRGGRKNSSRIFPSPERPEAVALDKRWDKKKMLWWHVKNSNGLFFLFIFYSLMNNCWPRWLRPNIRKHYNAHICCRHRCSNHSPFAFPFTHYYYNRKHCAVHKFMTFWCHIINYNRQTLIHKLTKSNLYSHIIVIKCIKWARGKKKECALCVR